MKTLDCGTEKALAVVVVRHSGTTEGGAQQSSRRRAKVFAERQSPNPLTTNSRRAVAVVTEWGIGSRVVSDWN
jgi:hypothetical protein